MLILFLIVIVISNQFIYSQEKEKNMRSEAIEIMFKSYCDNLIDLDKECSITIDEFSSSVYLKHQSRLRNIDVKFCFFNSDKYLDEQSLLFVEKDSLYFLYDDFLDPEGTCFTKKTETLFDQIINSQSVTETNIIELINIHLFYRNLNGHIYNFLLPSKPMDISLNSCSNFNIKKKDNNSLTIAFLVWNRISSDIIEVLLQKNINKTQISTKKVGSIGAPKIKI